MKVLVPQIWHRQLLFASEAQNKNGSSDLTLPS
jgi:hypothetical protein